MASPTSPPGSGRRHGRNVSHQKSTRGPLEAVDNDPLADPISLSNPPVASTSETIEASLSIPSSEPIPTEPAVPEVAIREKPPIVVDLRFLLERGNYHKIPSDDIPEAFLTSPHQPPQGTPLPGLIQHGHFRRAAEAALDELLQCDAFDAAHILPLLYTRLACLVLTSRPDLASHEAAPLTDFLAHSPAGTEDFVSIIPWELRLLLVRLQSIAAADGGRRGIMALYALAGEIRVRLKDAKNNQNEAEVQLWSARLRDLGLRVADTLVEMGELETATRHLDTLTDVDIDNIAYRTALLRMRVGDIGGAQRCISKIQTPTVKASLDFLLDLANRDTTQAIDTLKGHAEGETSRALFANNLAVGLVYTGHISKAKELLETITSQSPAFPGFLFNLSTVYELCSERAVDKKFDLARQLADKTPFVESGGWERPAFELKL